MKRLIATLGLVSAATGFAASDSIEKVVAVQQAQIQQLINDNKQLRMEVEKQKSVLNGLRIWQFGHGWGYAQFPSEASSPWKKLPFSINAGHTGGAYLMLCSLNANDGDATRASLHFIRAGFNGNHYSMEKVGDSVPVIFNHRVSSDGFIEVQTYGGNSNCIIIGNNG